MRRYAVTTACVVVLVAIELLVWDGDTTNRLGDDVPVPALFALMAVSSAAAVLTWRWPVQAAIVVFAAAMISIAVPSWQPFGSVLVALYVVARTTSVEVSRMALALALVPLGINAWNSAGWQSEVTLATLVPVAGVWLLVAVATWWAGRAGHRSDSRVQDLEETLRTTEAEVRAQERRLIARDLHDIVAHSVTAMVLRAAGARSIVRDDEELTTALGDIEESGAQAVRELHRLLHTMHGTETMAEGEVTRTGLAHLPQLVDRTRSSGLTVEVRQVGTARRLDASLDVTAYRCVQESLSNAMRHGGAGSRVEVVLDWTAGLRIEVMSHSGPQAPRPSISQPGGFGLVGLSERLVAVGGSLDAGPADGGFRLRADLPLADTFEVAR